MTADETRKIIAIVIGAYPNLRDLPDDALAGIERVWVAMLADIPFEIGKLAIQQVLCETTIPAFPAIGRVRQAAAEIAIGPLPAPLEAYEMAVRALSRSGSGDSRLPGDLHPLVRAVIEGMGRERLWWECCSTCPENRDATRREFIRHYEELIKQERRHAAMMPAVRQRLGAKTLSLPLPEAGIEGLSGARGV